MNCPYLLSVGWALPTDHLEPKQKDFKLLDSITSGTLRERAISIPIVYKAYHW
jgi:hypothetical protein